ncbi:Terminase small subunit [Serratia entomophila]|uniref:terminase small subunit n=1 Tax=Serratia entomophila TaxID=42906 RepID=UPI001F25A3EF|nr:terminase small subunit [Serratia entomophila]UIW20219.1 terminase small subunit [Serratia entomophila]CAI0775663.1 Terminase small subunit [Serratia entomophila]CAI0793342.1 Terminase small subunit [Serratia entomophila]CAI0807460.1 Terminase small subunit [Serratia entomophila]CAI0815269.1 Terminase small subunit [Serratia entomophila]
MSKPDWAAIAREYRAGQLSIRALAEKYGISDTAIRKKAKADNWPKPDKVRKDGSQKGSANLRTNTLKKTQHKIESQLPEQSEPESEFQFNPSDYGLSEQQALFVHWFLIKKNRVDAYRQAGYKCQGSSVYPAASQVYRNINVQRAIRDGLERQQKRYGAELDEIVHQLVSISRADPNDLVQFRRVNCRYCWGENHLYQWRDIGEFDKAAEKASSDGKPEPEYGGLGFVENLDPNPDCPICCGEGEGHTFISDTRNHVGSDARWLYAGIKQTQHGIQVMTADQDAARRNLIQLLTAQRAGGSPGDRPPANSYTSDDYRAAASSLDDEFGDLD